MERPRYVAILTAPPLGDSRRRRCCQSVRAIRRVAQRGTVGNDPTKINGRSWRNVCALIAASVPLLAPGLDVGAAPAPPQVPDPCPPAFPVAELTPGMVGSGLTVERGTVADPFTATVLGVVDEAIAPGVDLIVVEVDSPAIQRAGGVWLGMSGSPVYAEDGRLIGAVAYLLAEGARTSLVSLRRPTCSRCSTARPRSHHRR
jgi:SpoIVB peptidase S55